MATGHESITSHMHTERSFYKLTSRLPHIKALCVSPVTPQSHIPHFIHTQPSQRLHALLRAAFS